MRAEELLDGIRVRPGSVGGNQRIEELQESFRGARWEVVDRMTDDVGVNMFAEMEANRKAARAGTLRVVIGNGRNSRKIREPRTATGVEFRCRCGARVSEAASDEGVNVPVSRMPFACAGLTPG
jgi:hypothetical protein